MNELETILPILNRVGISNSREAIEFADQYLGGTLRQIISRLGEILDDNIRLWQFKNQVNIAIKAKNYCNQKGIENPRQLKNAVIVPLIEDAKNIEDETLADMFAGLLANQLNPSCYNIVHPSYSKIITELSPYDAKTLLELYNHLRESGKDYRKSGFGLENKQKVTSNNPTVSTISFQNLWRLGICDHGGLLENMNKSESIFFTHYGWLLMKACIIDK